MDALDTKAIEQARRKKKKEKKGELPTLDNPLNVPR
jgi:hypothetical protein